MERLGLRIDFHLLPHQDKRVLVFDVPSRPVGVPIQDKGIVWWRKGDVILQMPMLEMRAIFAESGHDYSADICKEATISDLDGQAVEAFRQKWIAKKNLPGLASRTKEQLLTDCEAITPQGITYAALVLFGTHEALGRFLGQSEVVFEYRSSEATGPAQQREEFRQGFFAFYDRLWTLVNLRNNFYHYQDGLFMMDIPTFDERVVREVILNAVSHRDYQLGGSVFIRQYPNRLIVDSPGGFPPDITLDNILDRQSPRNRRIADILSRCGLVERSGIGMNRMFEVSIQQAKPLPDFAGTDRMHVRVALNGIVQDPKLLIMMQRIGEETLESFSTEDFLVLNHIRCETPLPNALRGYVQRLFDMGIVEKVSRNRFVFGRKYYATVGKKGVYTRKKGLDRDTNKALLLKHISDNSEVGSKMNEFAQILPGHSRSQIQVLLRELRKERLICSRGISKGAKWYPGDLQPEP
jgi:ATP-dependent DNA helicase RecG